MLALFVSSFKARRTSRDRLSLLECLYSGLVLNSSSIQAIMASRFVGPAGAFHVDFSLNFWCLNGFKFPMLLGEITGVAMLEKVELSGWDFNFCQRRQSDTTWYGTGPCFPLPSPDLDLVGLDRT